MPSDEKAGGLFVFVDVADVVVVVAVVVIVVVVFIEENPIIALSKNFFIIRFRA